MNSSRRILPQELDVTFNHLLHQPLHMNKAKKKKKKEMVNYLMNTTKSESYLTHTAAVLSKHPLQRDGRMTSSNVLKLFYRLLMSN